MTEKITFILKPNFQLLGILMRNTNLRNIINNIQRMV